MVVSASTFMGLAALSHFGLKSPLLFLFYWAIHEWAKIESNITLKKTFYIYNSILHELIRNFNIICQ